MKKQNKLTACLGILAVLMIVSRNAYAYIDPGSGSYLIQLLIAGLVGASFAIKTFWKSICMFFSAKFGKKEKQEKTNG